MKRSLIYAIVLTLGSTAIIAPSYASAGTDDGRVPHVDGNSQFPPTRWGIGGTFRHTFRLHVPQNSKAVTQILVKVPDNVTISNNIHDINVVDEKGQKININVSVNGKTILLAFAEPVAPNSKLEIDLNKIKRRNLGNGSVYSFSAREVGIDAEIPIGVAWFRFY
ncbi:DUF2808 domain-containing protein [Nostoc sp. 'Peltigera membranacea cyanobiont' N6]|uniref:DUF2808 domain-containing protein n=1 Tax=Nostoc sp. 'Peltigera membranacea cyanobiont' N6 TaxID=1261031 RepID=UPI000CF32E33|nr:DUF2808 domain-containing protein [Nostoc sp. 'Peltigera membranacea cyanobiont' N6]AVH68205.1 protein of unknown function DUF2808 [Nostoc sp. 'Peltigera membranacea cyanobiont' N6]